VVKCWLLLMLALAGVWLSSKPARAQSASKEYQLKAAFLFNFAQFVEWPADAFPNAESPFYIGVLGDNPFGTALEETVRGESIQGHKIMVLNSRHLQELEKCQIIFITRVERARIGEVLSKLKGRKTLTVGETPGFAQRGGMINFYVEGNKLRFEINPAAAHQEGLKISSQLLSLGRIVEPDATKGSP